jgi:large subunit ribosomal protein L19e
MVNLRLQKRLAASVLKCGRRKIWLDPNEMNEVGNATTRTSVRKLVRDGFIIKKPQKIHSRFRARQRAIEKKKGRHLGHGSRKGTRNARCSTKMLWMKRQRAMRRLLKRYRECGKIDRRMYHRYYMSAKGNSFKNKANLIEHIEEDLAEKQRNAQLLEQYKVRRAKIQREKQAKEERRQKYLSNQLKLSDEMEKIRQQQQALEQEASQQQPEKKRRRRAKKEKSDQPEKPQQKAKDEPKQAAKKDQKAKKGKKAAEPAADQSQQQSGGAKKRRRRGKGGAGQ